MTSTEKLKLKNTIRIFGTAAAGVGYKLAKSGKHEITAEMQNELEDAMLPLVLQHIELWETSRKLQNENRMLMETIRCGYDKN